MTRVKKGVHALKRRRNILHKAKGYRFGRSTKERQAREAVTHAGVHSFAHRKDRKNEYRRLWNVRINASARLMNLSYSRLMHILKKKKINIDRKILSHLAEKNPKTFERLIKQIS
ncbi:MAG: 50S ribosomal protein L20 [Candidatus Pacebacteria bacterium]|nr:50S ribosomal protein L20 [Candidatus Paceibacterota bacterium]